MTHQDKAVVYDPSEFVEDGRAMRTPPAGTVATSRLLGEPTADLPTVPLPLTLRLLERGRERYTIVCATCHGDLGDAQTKVAEKMELRKPPSLVAPPATGFTPGRLYEVISSGYGLMPAFAAYMTPEDRWAVVGYVQALQAAAQGVPLASLPPSEKSAAEAALTNGSGARPLQPSLAGPPAGGGHP
jgi:mono/diheme cytochrome c family protein